MLAHLQPGVLRGSKAIVCLKQNQTSPQKHEKQWDEIWRILKENPKKKSFLAVSGKYQIMVLYDVLFSGQV